VRLLKLHTSEQPAIGADRWWEHHDGETDSTRLGPRPL